MSDSALNLSALEAARAAATQGIWTAPSNVVYCKGTGTVCSCQEGDPRQEESDAHFIALAANEWGRMLSELRRNRHLIDLSIAALRDGEMSQAERIASVVVLLSNFQLAQAAAGEEG